MPITLRNVQKAFTAPDGTRVGVLNVPHFEIGDGEHVALVGGSGTGKTTLLHSIAGIAAPGSGSILFDLPPVAAPAAAGMGHPAGPSSADGATELVRLSEAARDVFRGKYIGYIFQTHHLLPGFTALENVLLGMTFTGRAADRNWARHLLAEVGLSDRADYRPSRLSVGQQQRVAVARALANRPRLVLADEPTGSLDPATAQQVLDVVQRLCREINASLLLVTHDPSIASQMQRVVRLDEINRRQDVP